MTEKIPSSSPTQQCPTVATEVPRPYCVAVWHVSNLSKPHTPSALADRETKVRDVRSRCPCARRPSDHRSTASSAPKAIHGMSSTNKPSPNAKTPAGAVNVRRRRGANGAPTLERWSDGLIKGRARLGRATGQHHIPQQRWSGGGHEEASWPLLPPLSTTPPVARSGPRRRTDKGSTYTKNELRRFALCRLHGFESESVPRRALLCLQGHENSNEARRGLRWPRGGTTQERRKGSGAEAHAARRAVAPRPNRPMVLEVVPNVCTISPSRANSTAPSAPIRTTPTRLRPRNGVHRYSVPLRKSLPLRCSTELQCAHSVLESACIQIEQLPRGQTCEGVEATSLARLDFAGVPDHNAFCSELARHHLSALYVTGV